MFLRHSRTRVNCDPDPFHKFERKSAAMSDTTLTQADVQQLQAAIRKAVREEVQAAMKSQHGFIAFLKHVGLHALASKVAHYLERMVEDGWKWIKKQLGWS